MNARRSLGVTDLVFLNIAAITSLRWTASAASSGASSLTLWILASVCFFVPEGLAVAQLAGRYPDEGGLYRWTQRALGEKHGFLCGWCYWVNNLLYFPSLLLYVSANAAIALEWGWPGSHLAGSKPFVVAVTLGTLWLISFLSFLGIGAARWLQNLGALGNWVPALVIAGLATVIFARFGSATPLSAPSLVPHLGSATQLSFFAEMCFALAGLELLSFFAADIESPRRSIMRSILISAVAIVAIYEIGTLGILICIRPDQINLLNGILLPIERAGKLVGAAWLVGPSAFFLVLAGLGALMAWFAGAARVPYLVGVDRYLPQSFGKLHPRFKSPYVAIVVQSAVATLFTLFATAGADTALEGAYKVLVDMCLVLYFIPYAYLFVSMWKLEGTQAATLKAKLGVGVTALVGFATTLLAIATTAIPTGDGSWPQTLKAVVGSLLMIGLGLALYARGSRLRLRLGLLVPRPA